jgi:hypothetical protein
MLQRVTFPSLIINFGICSKNEAQARPQFESLARRCPAPKAGNAPGKNPKGLNRLNPKNSACLAYFYAFSRSTIYLYLRILMKPAPLRIRTPPALTLQISYFFSNRLTNSWQSIIISFVVHALKTAGARSSGRKSSRGGMSKIFCLRASFVMLPCLCGRGFLLPPMNREYIRR